MEVEDRPARDRGGGTSGVANGIAEPQQVVALESAGILSHLRTVATWIEEVRT